MALLISICTLEQIPFTGSVIHEWLGLAFVAMVVWHLLLSWSWISTQTRHLFPVTSARVAISYLLNFLLFAMTTAVIYSGIRISQEAIPRFTGKHTPIPGDSPWFFIHNNGSDLVVILAALHLALNWDWIFAAIRRLVRREKVGAL